MMSWPGVLTVDNRLLEISVVYGTWERNNVTYVTHTGYVYNQTFETETET